MRATIRLCLETRPLSPGTPRTSQRPQPVLSRCPCWAHHSCLQGWPWGLCVQCRPRRPPSPELEELSEHRSCERPSVGPAALLWSPCSEAARPACLAGHREHVPVRAASGSWAHTGPLQVTGGPLPGAACGPLCTLCLGPPPSPAIKRYPPAPLAHHPCLCPVTTPPPAPAGSSWGPAGCGRDRTIAPS